MGMYTQLHLGIDLKKDTPEEVINILKYLSNPTDDEPKELPKHEFFQCDRWKWLFTMDSYYFDYKTQCAFTYDDVNRYWNLSVTSNLKNYCGEIEKFIDWIKPYINSYPGDFLGYSRYEEFQDPIIIKY
jgi:hypothetical protein